MKMMDNFVIKKKKAREVHFLLSYVFTKNNVF